ncbi:MAG: VanZ family protein [Actinomycetia bacterium]|nr:VanZ family protein [Actinomycetes bacterium]
MRLVDFFLQGMLRYVLVLLPVYMLFRALYLLIKRRKPVWAHELLLAVGAAYGISLVSQTLLPQSIYGLEDLEYYTQNMFQCHRSYNLIPMRTVWAYLFTQNDRVNDWGSVALLNLSANIGLFIPLGVLAPMLGRRLRRLRSTVLLGLAISFAIEAGQYLIGRSADVDDLILNVFGVVIGYGIWAAVRRTDKALSPSAPMESGGEVGPG